MNGRPATTARTYEMTFEKTPLYKAISNASTPALQAALEAISVMSKTEINQRSEETGNSFLHVVVLAAATATKLHGSLRPLIPVVYRLASTGIDVNATNTMGNTCLHVSCFKAGCEELCEHFIKIGVDPSIVNKHGCSVVHNYEGRACYIVKGQPKAKSGIWCAVEAENYKAVEEYLYAWTRVSSRRRNRSLKETCEATGNTRIKSLLASHEAKSELACAALGLDPDKVRLIAKEGSVDVNLADMSFDVPKPLVIAVSELVLGDATEQTVAVLKELGASNGDSYADSCEAYTKAFEASELYAKMKECTRQSLKAALDLLSSGKINVKLRSFQPETEGWTYLHLVVELYQQSKDYVVQRQLVRILYRLALLDAPINAKDAKGQSALIMSFNLEDQTLVRHLITIGIDPSLSTPEGSCIGVENYLYKGRLIMGSRFRRQDIPGLWVAVEDNDSVKAKEWLCSWVRVRSRKNGRSLKDLAHSQGHTEMLHLLESYEHTNEFVCATFACDLPTMKLLVSLGKRLCDVNPVDIHYLAGFKTDLSAECVPRPLIIPAMRYCTAEVVDFLVKFGADLTKHYEEAAPCGPAAFYAFHDDIDGEVTLAVATHAEVALRDELGQTMLHKAVLRRTSKLKREIVRVLLDRKVNVAARDVDGHTARDYLTVVSLARGGGGASTESEESVLVEMIDEHVVGKVTNDEYNNVEQLMLEGYDHILDIKGHQRKKEAKMLPPRELAYVANLKEMVELLDSIPSSVIKIKELQDACRRGDIVFISKNFQENRCIWAKDKYGRTLMHLAILHGHAHIVKFFIGECPDMVKETDNALRTPLHYAACSELKRQIYGSLISGAGADPNAVDVNNLSVHDYSSEMENPTPKTAKPRGRQYYDYQVQTFLRDMLARDEADSRKDAANSPRA